MPVGLHGPLFYCGYRGVFSVRFMRLLWKSMFCFPIIFVAVLGHLLFVLSKQKNISGGSKMIDWIEVFGWIGSLAFALYSIPQALEGIRQGKTQGMSRGTILLILFGAFFSLLYILPDITSPLFYNFLGTFICGLIICRYHFFPRQKV